MPKSRSSQVTERLQRLTAAFKNELNAFIHISIKNKYVYVQTPKVASTTIKRKLVSKEIEGSNISIQDVPLHPDVLKSVHVKAYQIPDTLLDEVLFGPGYVRFCFVRDPFTRVLSSYLDKIVTRQPEAKIIYNLLRRPEDQEITFEEFVDCLYANQATKRNWDPHWRPQFALLRPDLISYHLVGKIETFDKDYAALRELLAFDLGEYETRAPHKTNAHEKIKAYYDKSLSRKVAQIYPLDFERFGYATEVSTV